METITVDAVTIHDLESSRIIVSEQIIFEFSRDDIPGNHHHYIVTQSEKWLVKQ